MEKQEFELNMLKSPGHTHGFSNNHQGMDPRNCCPLKFALCIGSPSQFPSVQGSTSIISTNPARSIWPLLGKTLHLTTSAIHEANFTGDSLVILSSSFIVPKVSIQWFAGHPRICWFQDPKFQLFVVSFFPLLEAPRASASDQTTPLVPWPFRSR